MNACAWCGGDCAGAGVLAELPACGLGCAVEAELPLAGLVVRVDHSPRAWLVEEAERGARLRLREVDATVWRTVRAVEVSEVLGWAPELESERSAGAR